MKKLIVFSVVLVLLSTFAFAQADFAAGGTATVTPLDLRAGGDPVTGFESYMWIAASKTNDDNTAGAKGALSWGTDGFFTYQPKDTTISWNAPTATFDPWGGTYFYAWWQPIEQVFFKLGKVGEDGRYWVGDGITGWGFQSNDLMVDQGFADWNGYAGGYFSSGHGFWGADLSDTKGMQLSIIPMDMIAINLGWNFSAASLTKDVFLDTLAAQIVVNIPGGFGTAAVGFKNGAKNDPKNIGLAFLMGLGDNMNLEVGIDMDVGPSGAKNPIDLGIGFRFGSPWGDTFWLSARVAASFATASGGSHGFGLELCPSYDLGFARLYAPLGFAMATKGGDLHWRVNPYIRKSMGGVEFWAGFMIDNGKLGDGKKVHFAVPVSLLWAW